MKPQSRRDERILYRASFAPWLRVLAGALAVMTVVGFGAPIRNWLVNDRGPDWVPIFSGVALVILLMIIWRGTGQSFVVSTAGLAVRGWFRTVRIPWSEVAAIEVDRRFLSLGQTVVVTRTGRRVGSVVTGARSAFRRGEAASDHGPDLLQPAIPTRAALDARERHCRGEF
ncbi:PH domain-containing protein [Microlunatus sp. GCM10028923]|uniref:PH domain-containing protein n=1 Tax=Microlunatus sp. GCM10028923 TaxID=3273400 RepID=UPI003621C797